jgi:integrase
VPGPVDGGGDTTVGCFLTDTWLPAVRGTIRPTTYSSYEMHVRCYLVPAFGPLGLDQLTAPAINAFYGELQRGWNGRAVLSASTVRRIHATLHRALRDAVRWQMTARNPAGAADPPRAHRPEMAVWTPAQLRLFLRDAAGDRHYTLRLFYILTGVRRGEALALRWSDVDLVAGTAAIRRSLVPVDHRLVFGEPKTERGRRLIGLDPHLVAALAEHRRHRHELLPGGWAAGDDDLVFAHGDGRPLHPERVSRWFSKVVGRTDVPPVRLHDMRHLHATLAAGVSPGSWPTGSVTVRRRSPPTSTNTCCRRWTATPPWPWRHSSSPTPSDRWPPRVARPSASPDPRLPLSGAGTRDTNGLGFCSGSASLAASPLAVCGWAVHGRAAHPLYGIKGLTGSHPLLVAGSPPPVSSGRWESTLPIGPGPPDVGTIPRSGPVRGIDAGRRRPDPTCAPGRRPQ